MLWHVPGMVALLTRQSSLARRLEEVQHSHVADSLGTSLFSTYHDDPAFPSECDQEPSETLIPVKSCDAMGKNSLRVVNVPVTTMSTNARLWITQTIAFGKYARDQLAE